jgi:hypothetical protein
MRTLRDSEFGTHKKHQQDCQTTARLAVVCPVHAARIIRGVEMVVDRGRDTAHAVPPAQIRTGAR